MFYKIDDSGIVHELNFVEAAKIYKANENENALKLLPDFHHEQVNKATEHFKTVVKVSENQKVTKSQLSAIEKRVLSVLPTFAAQVKDPFYKKYYKEPLTSYMAARTESYPTILMLLSKSTTGKINDLEIWVDKLYKEVLAEYKFSDTEPDNNNAKVKKIFAKPQIVISESFN